MKNIKKIGAALFIAAHIIPSAGYGMQTNNAIEEAEQIQKWENRVEKKVYKLAVMVHDEKTSPEMLDSIYNEIKKIHKEGLINDFIFSKVTGEIALNEKISRKTIEDMLLTGTGHAQVSLLANKKAELSDSDILSIMFNADKETKDGKLAADYASDILDHRNTRENAMNVWLSTLEAIEDHDDGEEFIESAISNDGNNIYQTAIEDVLHPKL